MTPKHYYFLIPLIFFAACKSDKKEPENTLFFENETLVKTQGEDCHIPQNQCAIISIDYPVATGPQGISKRINSSVKEYIIGIISSEAAEQISSLEELADDFIEDFIHTAEDFKEEPAWEAYINGRIYSKDDALISIGINSEIFRGGAHGYRGLSFLNFNPETGEQYSHDDLFTPEFRDYTEKIFREQQGIPAGEDINSTGFWFENNAFQLPQNVGFEKDNILLVYNAYEVAPYSAGNFYIEIAREEVESYLKLE